MRFIKAHSGANDFVILDSREEIIPENLELLVRYITDRRTGIGADGVVIIKNVNGADFKLRYFNPDGSEYGICGNGSLCALLYENKPEVKFETKSGLHEGCIANGKVRVKIPPPKDVQLTISISIKRKRYECSFVDIGAPHTIIFVPDVKAVDIMGLGKLVRSHPYFYPAGTNVNFVQHLDKNSIYIRTYERGVEGETYSCGSGTCSAVAVGWLKEILQSPVEVTTRGGKFKVYISGLEEIWFEGKPEIVFEGEIDLELLSLKKEDK